MVDSLTNKLSYRDISTSRLSASSYPANKPAIRQASPPIQDSLVSMAPSSLLNHRKPAARMAAVTTKDPKKASSPARRDKSILRAQKQGIIGTMWSILFGAQTSTAAISGGALSNGASLTKLARHASNSVGIGYFFYKIGSFINAAFKLSKKITLFRARNLAQESVTLGSATLGAVVSLAKFGWITIRAAGVMIGQVVFGALNIAKSLLSIIDIVRFAKAKKELTQISSKTEKMELTLQLKEILSSTKVMRSYLKDLFPTQNQLDKFNTLVSQNPASALEILKRSTAQGLVREAISLASNLSFSVGAIVGVFVPPVGLILTAIGGVLLAIDWIIGKYLSQSANKELNLLSQNT